MSESRPVYIPCASGNNAQTEMRIDIVGSLIRLMGHEINELTPDSAAQFAYELLDRARWLGWKDPEIDDGK